MNRHHARHAADEPHDPATLAAADQSHAMFRDLSAHLRDHCREALAYGVPQRDVAMRLAVSLVDSDHTRETFACLLGVTLADLANTYANQDRRWAL